MVVAISFYKGISKKTQLNSLFFFLHFAFNATTLIIAQRFMLGIRTEIFIPQLNDFFLSSFFLFHSLLQFAFFPFTGTQTQNYFSFLTFLILFYFSLHFFTTISFLSMAALIWHKILFYFIPDNFRKSFQWPSFFSFLRYIECKWEEKSARRRHTLISNEGPWGKLFKAQFFRDSIGLINHYLDIF